MPKLFQHFITLKEKCNMKCIGVGELVVDYYYKKNKFLGRMNGKSFQNICINLKYLGQNVKIIGSVGNDETGTFALNNLEKLQVETEIKRNTLITNRIYVVDNLHHLEWQGKRYYQNKAEIYEIKAEKDDIIIVDNIKSNIKKSIQNLSCEKVIDIGSARSLIYLKKEQLIERVKGIFTIININEKAYNIIKGKIKIEAQELCKLLNLKLLIITYGAKGISYYTPTIKKEYQIKKPYKEEDATGAGDAFFSILINEYIKKDRKITEEFLDTCFQLGHQYVKKVVQTSGALSHILPLQREIEKE